MRHPKRVRKGQNHRAVEGLEARVLLSAAPNPLSTSAASRAAASYAAMQTYFFHTDGSNLYNQNYPIQSGDNTYSYEWPFGQAYNATVDMANIGSYVTDLASRIEGLAHYYSANGTAPNSKVTPNGPSLPGYDSYVDAPFGGGGDKFYDDNEWTALASLQQYRQSGDVSALNRAQGIFSLITQGWDSNPSHPAPGGVFWTQASWSQDRNTVSNMPGAEIGLELYQITHNASYLSWATQMYNWVNTNLRDPSDGLYWDHIDLAGNIDKTKWTYNQGVPIGVNVLFYELTGNHTYLQQAEQIANASLSHFGSSFFQQPAIFNAIYFRNLLSLYSIDHNASYANAAVSFGDTAWSSDRDANTGLFHFGGSSYTQLLEQAAMTEIYGLLAATPTHTSTVVTNTQDSGPGSLRDAIQNSNADTITFAIPTTDPGYNSGTGTYTIQLNSQLEISRNLTISGVGANRLTLAGNGSTRLLQVDAGTVVEVDGMKLTGGVAGASQSGGAVLDSGTLLLNACTLDNNGAPSGNGGAVDVVSGGTLLVSRSTFSRNAAVNGAAIYNAGVLNVSNSTFASNVAGTSGGAIDDAGAATLINCTISTNTGLASAGGAAIEAAGTLNVGNTILAANSAPVGPDVTGSASSQGYNLIGNTSGSTGWVSTDLTGTSAAPLNPKLAALGNYGGTTQTMALMPGSPALNAGSNTLASSVNTSPLSDQRGLLRIYGAAADIGALEAQPPALAGDINHDGSVNLSDLLTLTRNFGHVVALYELGDLDGNGSVNLADFLILARNFGNTGPATFAGALASDTGIAYATAPAVSGAPAVRRRV